ncbi:MAG: RES family NAD+ phosphorylase [Gallionella sp.]
MTVSVWRIATDTPTYTADDLSGEGAKTTGGRWNLKGEAAIYASSNIALACLETLVHLNASGLPLNRYLVRIDIPNRVWKSAIVHQVDSLPIGWDASPTGMVSLGIGSEWLKSKHTALLIVPSVIIPQETNILINSDHIDAKKIKATKIKKWLYDSRLFY